MYYHIETYHVRKHVRKHVRTHVRKHATFGVDILKWQLATQCTIISKMNSSVLVYENIEDITCESTCENTRLYLQTFSDVSSLHGGEDP